LAIRTLCIGICRSTLPAVWFYYRGAWVVELDWKFSAVEVEMKSCTQDADCSSDGANLCFCIAICPLLRDDLW